MKIKLALLAAAVTAFTSPLQADLVETNVSIAFKFYANALDEVEKPTSITLNYATASIKNADIIESINVVLFANPADDYPLNSKIIRRDYFDANGELDSTQYVIRAKDREDLNITEMITVTLFETIEKYKISTNGTVTLNPITASRYEILFDPDNEEESEEFDLRGIDRVSIKLVEVKSTENFVQLLSFNSQVSGYGYYYPSHKDFDGFYTGIVEGTLKVSGAKVVPIVFE